MIIFSELADENSNFKNGTVYFDKFLSVLLFHLPLLSSCSVIILKQCTPNNFVPFLFFRIKPLDSLYVLVVISVISP